MLLGEFDFFGTGGGGGKVNFAAGIRQNRRNADAVQAPARAAGGAIEAGQNAGVSDVNGISGFKDRRVVARIVHGVGEFAFP